MPPQRRSRRGHWIRVLAFGGLLALAVVIGWFATLPKLSTCLLQVTIGYPCPGCGMTRSVTSAVRGELLASLRFHPLGAPAVLLTLTAFLSALRGVLTGRDPFWRALDRVGAPLGIGGLVALFAIWIVRVFVFPEWAPNEIGVTGWEQLPWR